MFIFIYISFSEKQGRKTEGSLCVPILWGTMYPQVVQKVRKQCLYFILVSLFSALIRTLQI